MRKAAAAVAAAFLVMPVFALPGGAQAAPGAPPMGWSSRTLGCSVSDASVRQAADQLAPLVPLGYRYLIIDGCWQAADGTADPARFPAGMAALAEHLHAKGLKLGLSLSAGTKACAGAGRGSYNREAADAAMVREWGVDYVKYDWCSIPMADFPGQNVQQVAETLYPRMRRALGDAVVFAMNNEDGSTVPWLWGRSAGATTWRTNVYNRPIADAYANMVDLWETNTLRADYAGAGSWADPDLLQAGRGGMTEAEYRTQVSLWAVGASPLILQEAGAPAVVVGNPKVIAVDQDPLGAMGRLAQSDGWYHVVVKPLENGDRAVVLFNESDRHATISIKAGRLKLPAASRYRVEELWSGAVASTTGDLAASVPAHGALMYRVSASREKAPPLLTVEADPAKSLGEERPSVLEPGREAEIVTRVVNTGGTETVRDLTMALSVPSGWRAVPRGPVTARSLRGGEAFTVTWVLTPPQDAQPKAYDLRASVKGVDGTAVVTVAAPPGAGRSYLSDLAWLKAANYWGPVERDQNVGGKGQGDGTPLTIQGVRYPKGLGTHAPADIEYYTGGRCATVEFQAGVDDSAGNAGSVDVEVWADGGRVAHSGVVTGAQPARKVTAGVAGARFVRLVVTNGGDNATSDHADIADATITCE